MGAGDEPVENITISGTTIPLYPHEEWMPPTNILSDLKESYAMLVPKPYMTFLHLHSMESNVLADFETLTVVSCECKDLL